LIFDNPERRNFSMKKFIPVLTALAILVTGCNYKPDSVGRARDVLVFTAHRELVEQELAFALGEQVFTPQPTREFVVRYLEPAELANRLAQHGILIVGFEDDSLIQSLFPDLSANDSFALYRIKDVWAKNQSVLVFIARDTLSMLVGLKAVRSKIHEVFKYRLLERLEAMTYEKGKDEELSRKIQAYGFKLKVPKEWLLDERYAAQDFIWVHAHDPERSIFIYWEEEERADISRTRITALFYEGDYLDSTFTTAGPSYFRGNEAIRIEGVWQNEELIVGGPMITFAFNEGGRFWMIDAILFYPGPATKKVFWLNQLEVILATFEPCKKVIEH
jgi:hypothetical protein